MRNGIDTSPYQHPRGAPIDWAQVAGAGYRWAAIKLDEGDSDAYAVDVADVTDAQAAGLEVVVYHFARPHDTDAREVGTRFARLCDADAPGCRRALDIEDGEALGWEKLHAWCVAFVAASGTTIAYMNRNYCRGLAADVDPFTDDLWLAIPGDPPAALDCYAVQFGQGIVPGIADAVDLNIVSDLPSPPAPAPTPTPEVLNMDEKAIYDLYVEMYQDLRGGHDEGLYENFIATMQLPRDQWAGHVAQVTAELARPAPPA